MNVFQAIFAPLCALVACRFLSHMLRGRLPRRQGLAWFLIWGLAAGCIAFPQSASSLASLVGIGRGSDLVSYLAILVGLFVTVYFYSSHRTLENTVTELVRQQALANAIRGSVASPNMYSASDDSGQSVS